MAIKNIEMPEIIVEMKKQEVYRLVQKMTRFLQPIQCKELLLKMKYYEAVVDFSDECTMETVKTCQDIIREVKEIDYPKLVKNTTLSLNQQLVLANLFVVYNNANLVECDFFVNEFDEEDVLKKEFCTKIKGWATAVKDGVDVMLEYIASNMPCDEFCQKLLPKIYQLDGQLLGFLE